MSVTDPSSLERVRGPGWREPRQASQSTLLLLPLLLFLSFMAMPVPSGAAEEDLPLAKVVVLDYEAEYLTVNVDWPIYGLTKGDPFCEFEGSDESDCHVSDMVIAHRTVRVLDGSVQVTFDTSTKRATGKVQGHVDFPPVSWDNQITWANAIWSPRAFGEGINEIHCQGWFDAAIDGEILPGNYDKPPGNQHWVLEGVVPLTITARVDATPTRWGDGCQGQEPARNEERSKQVDAKIRANFKITHGADPTDPYVAGGIDISYPGISATDQEWTDDLYHGPRFFLGSKWKQDATAVTEWWGGIRAHGPATVNPTSGAAVFEVIEEGEEIDRDRVDWIFSYKDKNGRWVELQPVTGDQAGSLEARWGSGGADLEEWNDLLLNHGSLVGGTRQVEMKLAAVMYLDGEIVGESEEHTFTVMSGRVSLQICGPTTIALGDEEAVFRVVSFDDPGGQAQWIDWYFYFQDRAGEWVLADETQEEGPQDIRVFRTGGEIFLDYWSAVAKAQGTPLGETVLLEMKAVTRAISSDGAILAESNAHVFSVEGEKGFSLSGPGSLDVYPTRWNATELTLDFAEVSLPGPISLTLADDPPGYLDISVEPDEVDPEDTSRAKVVLNVTLDCSRAHRISLPQKHTITVKAESGKFEATADVVLHLRPAQWLIILYLAADTPPESNPMQDGMMNNLKGMLEYSERDDPRVGMIALVDLLKRFPRDQDVDEWRKYGLGILGLSPNQGRLFQIRGGSLIQLGDSWGQVDMGSADTLSRFLQEAGEKVPALHTHLILSDHGIGVKGLIQDFHQGDGGRRYMGIGDLDRALQGHSFDLITFDMCYMAQMEVLYEVRDHADYFTGSEVECYAGILDFESFLPQLPEQPNQMEGYLKAMVESYKQRWTRETYIPDRTLVTLSAIRSAKLDELGRAINGFADELHRCFATYGREPLTGTDSGPGSHFNSSMLLGSLRAGKEFQWNLMDIHSFALLVSRWMMENDIRDSTLTIAIGKLFEDHQEAVLLSETVIRDGRTWRGAGPIAPSGLSIVNPWAMGKSGRDWIEAFERTRFSAETSWGRFLEDLEAAAKIMQAAEKTEHAEVRLSPSGHELYLHAYDEENRHTGFNATRLSSTKIDLGIPGSGYAEYPNGTKVVILPGNITQFDVVVDGHSMQEARETYLLALTAWTGNQATDQQALEGEISANTTHTRPVAIGGGSLSLGETVVTGEEQELPPWFTENLPFLEPVARRLASILPQGLTSLAPYLAVALPLSLLFLLVALVVRSRGPHDPGEKS